MIRKSEAPPPHPWAVAQMEGMLSRPWDVQLWSGWWMAGYLNMLRDMGVDVDMLQRMYDPQTYARMIEAMAATLPPLPRD